MRTVPSWRFVDEAFVDEAFVDESTYGCPWVFAFEADAWPRSH